MKLFLDSSVLVAACASKTGASAFILGYCRKKKIQGYVSLDVVGEARKNVLLKFGERERKRLSFFVKQTNLKVVPKPSPEKIAACENIINEKDAPILAAFISSPAPVLITLDKKHFLAAEVEEFVKPKKILLPGEFVSKHLKPRED